MESDSIRATNLQVKCPFCSEWADWKGDFEEGREIECGVCRKTFYIATDPDITIGG